jgi:hypothetical protein
MRKDSKDLYHTSGENYCRPSRKSHDNFSAWENQTIYSSRVQVKQDPSAIFHFSLIKYPNFRVQSFDKTEIFVNDVALLALENPPKLPRDQVTCFFVYKIHKFIPSSAQGKASFS